MEKVPNQRTISVKKEKCDKNNYYTTINLQALERASKQLSANAFKFWIYLAKNQPNYTFALSKVATLEYCGFGESTYTKVFKELKEYGYLKEYSKDNYNFYEIPQDETEEQQIMITINKAKSGFCF